MDWLAVNALSLDILGPAFVAGLLILATHVPLGAIVLNRGIIFIDIALAQVAALGVVFGNLMLGATTGWAVQISAIAAAVGCSMLLTWTDKHFPAIQEAIIGVIYIVAAALQIVLLSYSPNGSEYLKELLVGQILWVSQTQLIVLGLISAAALGVWYTQDLVKNKVLFYGVFAVVITASVQIVGVLLVFASLIVPALATQHAPKSWRLMIAFNIGVVGYLTGLIASAVLDISTGAAIVCTLVFAALMTAIAISRTGAVPADLPTGHLHHGSAAALPDSRAT
jgi:zinc/manganese transport system permease protein